MTVTSNQPASVSSGRIRRHFSQEGVDPYSTVRWERRDARLVNSFDGSTSFEQFDVEFPEEWSLTASNIVAQKYFRGSLQADDREYSLRQVVQRVTSTIRQWGESDGYFDDADEAQPFESEMAWLLLQRSFSSVLCWVLALE